MSGSNWTDMEFDDPDIYMLPQLEYKLVAAGIYQQRDKWPAGKPIGVRFITSDNVRQTGLTFSTYLAWWHWWSSRMTLSTR